MSNDQEQIDKILNLTRKKLEKAKIDDAEITMGHDPGILSVVKFEISSGIPELDLNLGGKCGLPSGKIIEYFGWEGSGKTTAALHAIAEVQRMGGLALFVDTEHTFSKERAEQLGVDVDRLHVASASSIESVFTILEEFILSVDEIGFTGPVLLVVDSITGVPTKGELQKEIHQEARVGNEAKQIRRGVKRTNSMLAKTNISSIFINHNISKIAAWGKQSESAGGHGLKFFSTVRVSFTKTGTVKEGDIRLGDKIKIEIEKLKNAELSNPIISEIYLMEYGFDKIGSLLEAACSTGWIDHPKSSKTYSLNKGSDSERQFKRSEWPEIVESLGGYYKVYNEWKEHGKVNNKLFPWGE
jgi:recombination protein RecA